MAIADSNIRYTNLAITPSAGVVTLDGPWLFETFAHADNSLAQTDSRFAFGTSPGSASATASVTWASTSAGARTQRWKQPQQRPVGKQQHVVRPQRALQPSNDPPFLAPT